jgi:hypothetical protein
MNEIAWGERRDGDLGEGDFVPSLPGWRVWVFDHENISNDEVFHLVGWLRMVVRADLICWVPAVVIDGRVSPVFEQQGKRVRVLPMTNKGDK